MGNATVDEGIGVNVNSSAGNEARRLLREEREREIERSPIGGCGSGDSLIKPMLKLSQFGELFYISPDSGIWAADFSGGASVDTHDSMGAPHVVISIKKGAVRLKR
jgi:hypothetical protein